MLVNRDTKFVATTEMKEADERRDAMGGIILQTVRSNLRSAIAKKQEAARWLDAKLVPYAEFARHEYSKETSEVHGMIDVLSTPAATEHIKTLGLTDKVEALAGANTDFEAAFNAKTAEIDSRSPQADTSTTSARRDVDEVYEAIVRQVNAYAVVQPTKEITQFIGTVSALVSQYKTIAANQGKKTETTAGQMVEAAGQSEAEAMTTGQSEAEAKPSAKPEAE